MLIAMGCVYQIRNLVNGKRYVGSTTQPRNRFYLHRSQLGRGKHHAKHLQRAWDKYGGASFAFEIIETFLDVDLDTLLSAEQAWMNQHRVTNKDFGYNNVPIAGSNAGCVHSAEVRERNRARMLGRKFTPEHKAAIGDASRGRTHSAASREKIREASLKRPKQVRGPMPDERKEKIRQSLLGRKADPESVQKAADSNRGKKRTSDQRAKISQALKGKIVSDITREKLRIAGSHRVVSDETKAKIRATFLRKKMAEDTA